MTETVDIAIAVDTREAKNALADMETATRGMARALSSAFTGLVVQGKDFSSVIEQLATRLSNLALTAALKPLESGIASMFTGLSGGLAFAQGGVLDEGRVRPFARGGLVAAPTYFPMNGGASLGLMGEKGAEAIMPLARGSDGHLGVRMTGGGSATTVTVNVSTPDLSGFRRSDAYLSGLVGRAVARAQRGA